MEMPKTHPYTSIVGKTVVKAFPIKTINNNLCGVQILFEKTYLNFIVAWDECHILWGKRNPEFEVMKVKVIDTE